MASVPRWVLAVVGVVVLVAAVDVGAVLVARGGHDAAADPAASSLSIDPDGARVVARVDVGAQPTLIATGFGGAWVLNKGEGTRHAHRRAFATTSSRRSIRTRASTRLTVGAGGVWFVGTRPRLPSAPLEEAKLERIDPATGAVDRTFDTHDRRVGRRRHAEARSGRPATSAATSAARRARMRPPARFQRLELTIYGDLIAASDDAVYYVGSLGSRVVRVSTHTGKETNEMTLVTDASLAAGNVPANPTGVAVGGGSLWISESDGNVLRIDDEARRHLGADPGVSRTRSPSPTAAGSVWTACGNGTVARVEPATDRVSAVVPVGRLPRGIAVGEGAVWVTLN